jgi:hypothetical protein
MDNILHTIFITYWSQITLLCAGIGFFIQRYLSLKSKKAEINFSLFQQKRLDAVNRFFQNYSILQSVWHQLPIWNIFERKITGKQIDEMIWPFLNNLQGSIHELKIYFPEDQHPDFQQIYNNFLKINGVVAGNLRYNDQSKDVTHKVNDYEFLREDINKKNQELIEKISILVRQSFKITK